MLTKIESFYFLVFILFSTLCSENKKTDNILKLLTTESDTFFPLIIGSFWYYEKCLEGELQKGNFIKDSVSEVSEIDSIIIITIHRKVSGGNSKTFLYNIDNKGLIFYQRRKDGIKKPFCKLIPQPGDTVGEMSYSTFTDTSKTQITLQTSEYDKASGQEQMEWQGKIFKSGVGITSFGTVTIGYELIEYRIGPDGPIIKYFQD